jgi:hypothetical protein
MQIHKYPSFLVFSFEYFYFPLKKEPVQPQKVKNGVVSVHAMKANSGRQGIVPLILNLGTRRR